MKRMFIACGICIVILLAIVFGVDPSKVPSFVLIIPFVLFFAVLLITTSLLLQKRGVTRKKSLQIGSLCAGVPMVLLVLQSIGQLTLKDVLTIVILFALSYFYISRAAVSAE